jgi:hypothetical protein
MAQPLAWLAVAECPRCADDGKRSVNVDAPGGVAVAELNALGLNYTLSSGAGKQAKTAPAKEKRYPPAFILAVWDFCHARPWYYLPGFGGAPALASCMTFRGSPRLAPYIFRIGGVELGRHCSTRHGSHSCRGRWSERPVRVAAAVQAYCDRLGEFHGDASIGHPIQMEAHHQLYEDGFRDK